MARGRRPGKVFVDWEPERLREIDRRPVLPPGVGDPDVSTPVSWDEIAEAAESGRGDGLTFLADAALARAEAGDLFAPVLSVQQALPDGVGDR